MSTSFPEREDEDVTVVPMSSLFSSCRPLVKTPSFFRRSELNSEVPLLALLAAGLNGGFENKTIHLVYSMVR